MNIVGRGRQGNKNQETERTFERQVGRRFEAKRRYVREVGAEMGHVRGFGAKKKLKRALLEAILEPRWR